MKRAGGSQYPSIDPGELRHQITFLVQTATTDASGSNMTYAPGAPPDVAWAKIDGISAADVIKGGQDVSQVRLIVTVRYRAGRAPNMRFQTSDGAVFVIEAIENPLRMNILQVMTCLGIGANS